MTRATRGANFLMDGLRVGRGPSWRPIARGRAFDGRDGDPHRAPATRREDALQAEFEGGPIAFPGDPRTYGLAVRATYKSGGDGLAGEPLGLAVEEKLRRLGRAIARAARLSRRIAGTAPGLRRGRLFKPAANVATALLYLQEI